MIGGIDYFDVNAFHSINCFVARLACWSIVFEEKNNVTRELHNLAKAPAIQFKSNQTDLISAYLYGKQILPFAFARECTCIDCVSASTLYKSGMLFRECPYDLAMQCNAMQCNAMQCNAMQCNATQCNAMQCNAMQYNAMQYNAIQYNAMQCSAMLQCNAMQCNAMQCNAMQCNAMQCNAMQFIHYQFPSTKGSKKIQIHRKYM